MADRNMLAQYLMGPEGEPFRPRFAPPQHSPQPAPSITSGELYEQWAPLGRAVDDLLTDMSPGFRDIQAVERGERVNPKEAAWRALEAFGGAPMAHRVLQGVGSIADNAFASMGGTRAKPQTAAPAQPQPAPQPQGIRAYHGSPHDFDRFDMSKIGTGEGAQAYGHGLYFAEKEGVAKEYKKQLTDRTNFVRPDGSLWSADGLEHMNVRVTASRGDIDGAIRKAQEIVASGSSVSDRAQRDLQKLIELKASGGVTSNPGRMYEVNIKANPDDFLDWDRPLSQQSEKVSAALSSIPSLGALPVHYKQSGRWHVLSSGDAEWSLGQVKGGYQSMTNAGPVGPVFKTIDEAKTAIQDEGASMMRNATPSTLMSRLGGHPGDPAASQAFREAGIPGIRYLDQGSRAAGDGSRNYVVFDDSLIEILRKYGLLGMIGGGAYAATGGAPQAQAAPSNNLLAQYLQGQP